MAGGAHQKKPISLFYSYSHRDEALRDELEAHLAFLRRSNLIAEWHDRMIGAGDEWKGQIDLQLATADIILLLVSADFIASDYCWGEEVTKALARHQLGEVRVIPVILRPCRWQRTPLGSLQAVPKDGRPVNQWPNHDAAFDEIAAAIERTIADLQQQRCRASEQTQQQAHKRTEAKARQAVEEQQRDAQQRREQDETRRAPGAEAARVPKTARYSGVRGRRWLRLMTAVALISLAGFAGVFAWQVFPCRSSSTIRVPARPLDWSHDIFTSSNIPVEANQIVTFNAYGQWYIDAGLEGIGPKGVERWCECVVSKEKGEGRQGRLGALIGRIGEDAEPFLVGAEKKVTAEKSGIIFLGINDNMAPCLDLGTNRGSCYEDNHGELKVNIHIE